MKLLTPTQNRDARQADITRQLLRAKEASDIEKENYIKLAKSEAEFNASLARNRLIWASEEEAHGKSMKAMENEVIALEGRKKQALIPIKVYKDEADKIMVEAREIFDRAKLKEEKADGLLETLEEKLTEVADREQAVSTEENRQKVALSGITFQQEETKKGVDRLTQAILDFKADQEQEEASLLTRKTEVALAEVNFKAKTDKYARDLEAMRIWGIQLKDKEDTLARSFDRLNK